MIRQPTSTWHAIVQLYESTLIVKTVGAIENARDAYEGGCMHLRMGCE